MTVLDLTTMQVRADVPELDVGRLAVGQPVEVSVNALPGQALPGTVSAVEPAARRRHLGRVRHRRRA